MLTNFLKLLLYEAFSNIRIRVLFTKDTHLSNNQEIMASATINSYQSSRILHRRNKAPD